MRPNAIVATAFTALMFPAGVESANLTCSTATTLDALATCIRNQMPASGSNGFVAPNASQRADWRSVVQQMLTGSCSISLPGSLVGIMEVRTFTDTGNGRPYCLLMEVLDANRNGRVDRGWGTFMVYGAAAREVSHQAPHPISDSTTENQAIGVFRDTDSRSYLMAGAHRSANSGSSSCQSSYGPADVAHNVDNMFHATNEELMAFYGPSDWWAIQWHGMAADTCSAAEVYLSHGRDVVPSVGDKSLELKTNMLGYHPTWDIETTGVGACSLNATDNTQGRLINGVSPSSVCTTAAGSYSGRFLHAEQDPGFRTPSDWAQAVKDTWPTPPTSPPPPPATLNATSGNAQVSLSWSSSAGAVTYNVYRSTTSGGPYAARVTGLTSTAFIDSPLTNGTTYFYVVSAVNQAGESADSPQASATPAVPAPTFVAAGTVASGTGTIAPALPAGIATGDILLLFVETANQTVSISSANGGTWTAVTGSPQGTGTAGGSSATGLTAFWSRYNGTQGAPTVSDSGNHQLGRMIAVRGAPASGDPWDVTAGGIEATSDTSGSIPGATTTVADTLVVVAVAGSLPDANSTSKFSGWANASLTSLTERTDNSVTAGNGGALGVATGIKATAGAYGNTTVTHANAAVKGMLSIAIKNQ